MHMWKATGDFGVRAQALTNIRIREKADVCGGPEKEDLGSDGFGKASYAVWGVVLFGGFVLMHQEHQKTPPNRRVKLQKDG